LSSPAGIQAHAFIPSSQAARKDWPDTQIYISSVGSFPYADKDISRVLSLDLPTAKALYQNVAEDMDSFTIMPTLVKPKSSGEIKLRDKNPLSQPIIDPMYLKDPRDVKVLIEGIPSIWKVLFKMCRGCI
jgi:choline dehydrogenase